jgi:hypothetical protein
MKNLLTACCAILLFTFVTSCGSDSGGTCGNTAACGGDVVGNWKITSACLSASAMMDASCPGATASASSLQVTGTATFGADMTYSRTTTSSGTETINFPTSCLSQGGLTITCAELGLLLMQNPSMGSGTCTGSTSCTCTVTLKNSTSTDTGTYTTTAAGVLTLTSAANGVEDDDYCVKGTTTLTVSPHAGSASAMGASGTIIFAKQ